MWGRVFGEVGRGFGIEIGIEFKDSFSLVYIKVEGWEEMRFRERWIWGVLFEKCEFVLLSVYLFSVCCFELFLGF